MSSTEPPSGGDNDDSHTYICSHCSSPYTIDPLEGFVLIEKSDFPTSSSTNISWPFNPEAESFAHNPPTTSATITGFASFERRNPNDDFVYLVSESSFFSSPYPNSAPTLTPLPAAGSVISDQVLQRYINDCLNEGAVINSIVVQREVINLIENYIGLNDPQATPPSAPPSSVAALPDVKVTEDHFASGKARCPVCMEGFKIDEEVKKLRCKHIYHKDCIAKWLQQCNSCPLCRAKLRFCDLNVERQSDVEQRSNSMPERFDIELEWPLESRFSQFEISIPERGQGSRGGENEASGTERQ